MAKEVSSIKLAFTKAKYLLNYRNPHQLKALHNDWRYT